jgi:heptosyltransferase-1
VSPRDGLPRAARILLVRTSAFGDIAQSLPVLTALRRAWPDARIAWVIDETFAPLLAGHRLLDELIPVPLRRLRRGDSDRIRELSSLVRRLRRFRADVALDLMGNHKAALLCRVSGSRRRIGLQRSERREPSSALWLTETVAARGPHAVDRALSVLEPLGVAAEPVDFGADALACGRQQVPSGDFHFIHPGAAWGNKRYPPALWGRVAELLGERTGVQVRVGAGPGEVDLANEVVAAAGGRAELLDAPSLDELAGAIRGAKLVLAGGTGAIHLARALARPLVAVHGPTDPDLHGPWGESRYAVWHRLPCSYCHRSMDETKPCLLGISPEAVVERALVRLAAEELD